ncbi:MAG: His-Xaa-Ser system radical SAM maturase HxsB, partial [Elusimicrobia bacterium]|nr:His-Xaa-Ser system radical SAM maturase HxsB [Elusimicrobiota bacterium]
ASLSWSQPQCFQCAYAPYCTVQPVFNHETQGSPWGQMPTNGWCEKMMGIFDVLFSRLQDPKSRAVLESWLAYKDR